MANKLTIKQQKFVDEYLICGNATQAAIKAGYSKKTAQAIGAENLSKPLIKNYIDERRQELADSKIADAQEVLEYLSSVMRGEQTEQTLASIGELGQEVIDIDVGAKDRLKAAEMIGKRFRLFTDKVDVNMTGAINIEIGDYNESADD